MQVSFPRKKYEQIMYIIVEANFVQISDQRMRALPVITYMRIQVSIFRVESFKNSVFCLYFFFFACSFCLHYKFSN